MNVGKCLEFKGAKVDTQMGLRDEKSVGDPN